MTWGYGRRPSPLESQTVRTVDTLRRERPMLVQKFAWLIGMTDDSDERLLKRARSYAEPPDVSVTGGVYEGWKADRRAHQIAVAKSTVKVQIKPRVPCVNPVFDLTRASDNLSRVAWNGRVLRRRDYTWDGQTLWLGTDLTRPTVLQLTFESPR